ncbi:cyclopropane fatty acyl phospholipid synthase [Candidatus Peregrinibacteria bacterium]|nr:cyclopropane fatty acyl phospholipid synthase [Candidatus Peregrinibacteria bacterium]
MSKRLKKKVQSILKKADIVVDGNRPWDIQVFDDDIYNDLLKRGNLALGEGYMDKKWEVKSVDQLIYRLLKTRLDKYAGQDLSIVLYVLSTKLFNLQNIKRSKIVGEVHYDVGNDLYQKMLDKRMNYSCGYWKDAENIDQAQENKLDLICRKLKLKPGDRVLEIGCGWGGFLSFAAEKYGINGIGVTISKEQHKLACERLKGYPVEIRLQDYREINEEKFDYAVSIGMFEHVGPKNYREHMEAVARNLKEGGLYLLHTIGGNNSSSKTDRWIDKYIFPNSKLPSAKEITEAAEGIFDLEDWHNFGVNYDKTLMAWYENFEKAWPELKDSYDEKFYRMWKYYLLSCAASFRARYNHLWQIVLSKPNLENGYESVR